jgi:hypothetical protein
MIDQLQVVGDSKLMIDWVLNKCSFKDNFGLLAVKNLFFERRILQVGIFPHLQGI